ncbi:MAG TPA: hypothetical protein VKT72_00940 [Candidatus Baltobacteraceae bacterium]|nr:hypothetical protein [Candidatus Baltobacteraceae bacterium]
MIGFGDRVSDPVGSGLVLAFALGFYVLGCCLLLFTGATFGTLHAFAGFIVLAIIAALNQLLPVLTYAPVARPQTVLAIALAFSVGFALLIAGFFGFNTFFAASIVLAASALVWVFWNARRLLLGKQEAQTRALMACAVLAFLAAAGIGASMAGALAGQWPAASLNLATLHASLAILGFASLLIVAISYRFVPMFAVAHGTAYGRRGAQWLAVAGVIIVAAGIHSPVGLLFGFTLLLIAAASIGYSHVITLASRLRKRLDVSLRYGLVAWTLAIVALCLALAAVWYERLWMAAVTLGVLGWISITILGYAFKVAGFLAWQTAKERDPSAQLPALSTAVNLPMAYLGLALLGAGAVASAVCNVVNSEHAQIGYGMYAAGGLLAVASLAKLAFLYVFRGRTNEVYRAVG